MKEKELYNLWPDVAMVTERQEPAHYSVMLHNDDFTPMSFVLTVLKTVFFMDDAQATLVMMNAHKEGKAIIGWFTQDVAATKINDVMQWSKKEEHPLMCSMEVAT